MAADQVSGLLRQADPERYFAHLFAPAPARPALAALYLLDHQLAHVRDHAREPAMGEIRLQWWAEALAGGRAEEARGHPLAATLLDVLAERKLLLSTLDAMVEARRADLYDDLAPTMTDVEGHAGETVGALLRLAALILAPQAKGRLADLAGHGGCALSIAESLRRLPVHVARGQCPLALDLLAGHGLDRAGFLAGGAAAASAVADFAARGREHLRRFLALTGELPADARPAFVLVAPAKRIFDQVLADPATALRTGVATASLRDRWTMLRAAGGRWPQLR